MFRFIIGSTVVVIDSSSEHFERTGTTLHPMGENILVEFSAEEIVEIPIYQLSLAT
jgi:hypothetical protein